MSERSYEIGGQKYLQKKLVFGQIQQLEEVLRDCTIPALNPQAIIAGLGNKICSAIAVVLIPEGVSLKDKTRDIEALAEELRFTIEAEQIMEIVNDFFICNPIASLLEMLAGVLQAIYQRVQMETGLTLSSVFSPEETSASETASSGDSLQET